MGYPPTERLVPSKERKSIVIAGLVVCVVLLSSICGYSRIIIDQLNSQKTDLEGEMAILENETDEWQHIYDLRTGNLYTEIITPSDATVMSKSRSILGSDADGNLSWSDRTKINNWVHKNVEYASDATMLSPTSQETDFWQKPSETLNMMQGDCEDHANLALSLMLAERQLSFIYCAEVKFSDNSWHVAVFVDVQDDKMYIFDPTWERTGTLDYGWESSSSQSEPSALSEWAQPFGGVALVNCLYNNNSEIHFSTLQEFYDWF